MLSKDYITSGSAYFLFTRGNPAGMDSTPFVYSIKKNARGLSVWARRGLQEKPKFIGRLMPDSGHLMKSQKQGVGADPKILEAFEWLVSLIWWSGGDLPRGYILQKLLAE
jgi:hypothetical protein